MASGLCAELGSAANRRNTDDEMEMALSATAGVLAASGKCSSSQAGKSTESLAEEDASLRGIGREIQSSDDGGGSVDADAAPRGIGREIQSSDDDCDADAPVQALTAAVSRDCVCVSSSINDRLNCRLRMEQSSMASVGEMDALSWERSPRMLVSWRNARAVESSAVFLSDLAGDALKRLQNDDAMRWNCDVSTLGCRR